MADILTVFGIIAMQSAFWEPIPAKTFMDLLNTCKTVKGMKKEMREARTASTMFGKVSCAMETGNITHACTAEVREKRKEKLVLIYKLNRKVIDNSISEVRVEHVDADGNIVPYNFGFYEIDMAMNMVQILGTRFKEMRNVYSRFAVCNAFIKCNKIENPVEIARIMRAYRVTPEQFAEFSALIPPRCLKMVNIAGYCARFSGVPLAFGQEICETASKLHLRMGEFLESDPDWCSYVPIAVGIVTHVLKKRTAEGDDITTRLPTILPCCVPTYNRVLSFLDTI